MPTHEFSVAGGVQWRAPWRVISVHHGVSLHHECAVHGNLQHIKYTVRALATHGTTLTMGLITDSY
jgi:hypothetical protein